MVKEEPDKKQLLRSCFLMFLISVLFSYGTAVIIPNYAINSFGKKSLRLTFGSEFLGI